MGPLAGHDQVTTLCRERWRSAAVASAGIFSVQDHCRSAPFWLTGAGPPGPRGGQDRARPPGWCRRLAGGALPCPAWPDAGVRARPGAVVPLPGPGPCAGRWFPGHGRLVRSRSGARCGRRPMSAGAGCPGARPAEHDPADRPAHVGQRVPRPAAAGDRQFGPGLPGVGRAVQEAGARGGGQGDHAGAAGRHGDRGRVAAWRCLPGQVHALAAVGGSSTCLPMPPAAPLPAHKNTTSEGLAAAMACSP